MLPKYVNDLIDLFSNLPSIGPRTATRIAFELLKTENKNKLISYSEKLKSIHAEIRLCQSCNSYSDQELCKICNDPRRDQDKIMIVENPLEIINIDSTSYNGVFHVIGGLISPMQGIGIESIDIRGLENRIDTSKDQELILALPTSLEGEATGLVLLDLIKKKYQHIKITKLARGMPTNSQLDNLDEKTFNYSYSSRLEI